MSESAAGSGSPAAQLLESSGLTAVQLGRLLGVSGRAVHGWAVGVQMPDHHVERLTQLRERIMQLGDDQTARRIALLNSSNGRSPYRQMLSEAPVAQRIHFPAYSVAEMLGF